MRVSLGIGENGVVAGLAQQRIDIEAAFDQVVLGPADEKVAAGEALNGVVAGIAKNRVSESGADKAVVADRTNIRSH